MSERITITHLKNLAGIMNRRLDRPVDPWTRKADGSLRANIGNFHIGQAYGGYCLQEMMSEGGGITCPLGLGHGPARPLFERMRAYLDGWEQAQREKGGAA